MPKATRELTTYTRRLAVLRAGSALVAAATAPESTAAQLPRGTTASAHSTDQKLITACQEFMRIDELLSEATDGNSDALNERYGPEFRAQLDIICTTRATTLEGHRARAAALLQYLKPDPKDEQPWFDTRLQSALLRDLAGGV